ncbi:terminase small subunit [Lactococcus petauri]|uniref:Terminase small subunit n=1 Tax=Lactococcus petauri TaxID=1940789 RepID=A0ABZ2SG69_9LACT|nr:terminase small subunit [Lactococcus petauri]OAL09689.1 phage terminase small subunit [Lactococcus garvieae]MCV5951976.1 terminase small subunit [Lactococcus petauri]MCV5966517.1 terminase small subunit [Lactococcus petauri]MCV5969429.1 terminase small subunit [Lactococcus petauri]MCV5979831.1 terminase small subunit [Lactococcus petauri]
MKLTKKQQDFSDYYIELGNAEKAAIKAGYSKSYARGNAHKLVANVSIKKYIDEKMAELASERIMSAQEILERLSLIASAEITETVVVANAEGYAEVEKPPDFKVQIQAMKELLKRYPGNDKLLEQQLRKLTAEADIIEKKASLMEDGNSRKITVNIKGFKDGD